MKRTTLLGVLAAGLALVACGDDGGETALGEDQQVGELTATEARWVCEDLEQPMELSKVDQCDLVGLISSSEKGECVAIWRTCLATAGEPLTSSRCNTSEFKGCTATVAEVKACMIAVTDTLKALSCGSILALLQTPEECAGVSAKCPSLLEDAVGF
ncbi:hypothetical protein WME79_49020 [Sorangium sp. So ce726]|uniref:hypothetical protein n=1 Tax=Sorangium sp. So ce726 TaxID=3133319 RepID=UPI003F5E3F43